MLILVLCNFNLSRVSFVSSFLPGESSLSSSQLLAIFWLVLCFRFLIYLSWFSWSLFVHSVRVSSFSCVPLDPWRARRHLPIRLLGTSSSSTVTGYNAHAKMQNGPTVFVITLLLFHLPMFCSASKSVLDPCEHTRLFEAWVELSTTCESKCCTFHFHSRL